MKKNFKIIKLSIFILILLLTVIVLKNTIFKTYHHINYKLIQDKNQFIIEEIYQNKEYYLNIKINNQSFPFINQNNYYKHRRIVQDIVYYHDNLVSCVMPIYKHDFDNEMLCIKNKQLMTYSNLLDYQPLKKFIGTIKDKYNHLSFIDSDKKTNYKTYQIYPDNFMNNISLIKWNYKGLDVFSNNNQYQSINILKQDLYTNKLGILVENKYLIPDYNSNFTFNQFYIIDITTLEKKILKSSYEISFDAYINGVVDNKIYLFDRENLAQYEIDMKKKTINIIGNKTLNGKYYDGSWEKVNIYDLKKEEVIFKNKNINNPYYYKNNIMYHKIKDQEVILFKMSKIDNIIIRDNYIYFIKDDTIYGYNDKYGLKKILINSELNFNKTNIYDFYINKD